MGIRTGVSRNHSTTAGTKERYWIRKVIRWGVYSTRKGADRKNGKIGGVRMGVVIAILEDAASLSLRKGFSGKGAQVTTPEGCKIPANRQGWLLL